MKRAFALLLSIAASACTRAEAQHAGMPGMEAPAAAADLPASATSAVAAGYSHVGLEPAMRDRLDLTTAIAATHHFTRTLTAYGAVVPDETRTSHVHAKVRGWIEDVAVNFTGREVQAGEVLCTLYSPEVYSAQLELLSMLATPSAQGLGEFVQADRQLRSLTIAAAKRRLQLWDMPQDEIQRLLKTHQAHRTFSLHAPRSGTVVAKQALTGLYADAATELYTVSDLTHVWVELELPGLAALHVKVGDQVQLSLQGVTELQQGAIAFLAPQVDEITRSVKARLELDNKNRQLRPGAFASAQVAIDLGQMLGVPQEAVIRTGMRSLVFIVLPTHIEPREIQLGEAADGWIQVLSGLQAGEIVATDAQFLLDSESRIRASSGQGHSHAR